MKIIKMINLMALLSFIAGAFDKNTTSSSTKLIKDNEVANYSIGFLNNERAYNYSKWHNNRSIDNLKMKKFTNRKPKKAAVFNSKAIRKRSNVQTYDLNEELRLYYNPDQTYKEVTLDWLEYSQNISVIEEFDLLEINPLDYKYIEFIGDYNAFISTRATWGDNVYYSPDNLFTLTRNKFVETKSVLRYFKICSKYWIDIDTFIVQTKKKIIGSWNVIGYSWIEFEQGIALTYYFEEGRYYLQVLTIQKCDNWSAWMGGSLFLNLGSGIRLYN